MPFFAWIGMVYVFLNDLKRFKVVPMKLWISFGTLNLIFIVREELNIILIIYLDDNKFSTVLLVPRLIIIFVQLKCDAVNIYIHI